MSSKLSTLISGSPLTGAEAALADGLYLYDASASGSAKSKGITLGELVKALRTFNAQANSTGDSTATAGVLSIIHTEVITFSGSAGTRIVALAIPTGLSAGARLVVRSVLPATAGIVVELRNATTGGTLLATFTTDGATLTAVHEFYFNGTAWALLSSAIPAAQA